MLLEALRQFDVEKIAQRGYGAAVPCLGNDLLFGFQIHMESSCSTYRDVAVHANITIYDR